MRRLMIITASLGVAVAIASATAFSAPSIAPGAPDRTPTKTPSSLAAKLALARLGTAKYATDLKRAKADCYRIITRIIPNMGYHYLNPNVKGFDVRKPAILVYVRRGTAWQLNALEWVFTEKPAKPPLKGARYGSFGAACHYVDGTFVFADAETECASTSPETGTAFGFWHPPLITLHVWLWYPNPTGVFADTNPLVAAFNRG